METPHERTTRTESGDPVRPSARAETRGSLSSPVNVVLPGWSEEQVLRRFRDVTGDIAVVLDLDARVVWTNRAARRLLGLEDDQHTTRTTRTILDLMRAEERAALSAALARIASQPAIEAAECEVIHAGTGGATRRVVWALHPLCDLEGRLVGYSGCGHDVTEQRQFQAVAQRTDARMSAVMASLLDPMITIDAYGTILSASDSVERDFGYPPAEIVGKNIRILMPEPHHSRHDEYLANYRRTNQTGIIGRTREFEVVRSDGSLFWVALSVSRADPSDGQDAIFTGTFRDITALKRATQALVESERRFHAIFDGAFQLIGLLSPAGVVMEMNQTALEAIGARREEVVGIPFAETRFWSHSPEMQARVRSAVQKASRGEFVRFEARSVAHDGALRDVDFSLKPVKDEAGQVVLLIPEGRDISELKRAQRAETAMLRAFAAIGESAALLAHEIKNPITAVHVALRAVATELGEDHRAILEDLVSRMQRIELMMRRTLSFTKPLDIRRVPCTATQLFSGVAAQLQDEIARARAELRVDVPTGDVRFTCDRQLLHDVLANLVTNALEAKGSDAVIVLSAARGPGGAVLIAVEDDGPGIPESMIDSLFRPFVTTKSKGNGLGLAICRKVVEEHGGTITAERGRACGARFEIRLPPEGERS